MPHRLSAIVGATLLALALAACGGESSDPAATSAAPIQTQSESVPAAAFPVTVEGDNGSLVVEQEPSRIVRSRPPRPSRCSRSAPATRCSPSMTSRTTRPTLR